MVNAKGDLFGTTSAGGTDDPSVPGWPQGTVFEFKNTGTVAAPSYSGSLTTLINFYGPDGQNPDSLTADVNGDLFGTTYGGGGASSDGTVFEIKNTGTVAAPVYSSTKSTLVNFNGSNGDGPSGLIADANGDLFGTTFRGGASNDGTVFEITNVGTIATPVYFSTPTTLVTFNGSNGGLPDPRLIADASGDLFGSTWGDGGVIGVTTVFEISGAFASAPTISGGVRIAGTAGSQTTTMEAPVTPFAGVTIGDANVGATDTLTITLGGAGGMLSGTGISGGVGGVYTLSGTPAVITSELDALVFTSKAGAPNTYSTTTFALSDLSNAGGAPVADSKTSVIDSDPTVAPTIAGAASGQTTTSEAPVKPFGQVTIGDPNAGATDTLTITLGGAGGTLADGTGFNSLTSVGAGVYKLSGTASAITSELDALVFTARAGAPNTYSTTTFTLSDQSSAGGAPVKARPTLSTLILRYQGRL